MADTCPVFVPEPLERYQLHLHLQRADEKPALCVKPAYKRRDIPGWSQRGCGSYYDDYSCSILSAYPVENFGNYGYFRPERLNSIYLQAQKNANY